MPHRLQDKVAVVTGGGSGIGAATAELFATEGAAVLIADRNAEGGTAVAERIAGAGNSVMFVCTDVAVESDVAAMVDTAVKAWGRLDILINNAGIGGGGSVLDYAADTFDQVIDTNVRGPLLCCKYALPHMLERASGSIVNLASISSSNGIPGQAIYAPSKAALLQLTRQLAIEFAGRGIRVNAVSPGTIETPLIGSVPSTPEQLHPRLKWLLERHPIGRFGKPAEVAAAILFLASDEASFITGAELAVDGGYAAQ